MGSDQRCIVIGGGLAGAASARALADRGWQVNVLDTASEPCAGASGVPVGVVSCHASPDDNPLSQLTRAGVQMTLDFARKHLTEGHDWSACGVLERRLSDGEHTKKPWQEPPHDSVWHSHVQLASRKQLDDAGVSTENTNDLWQPRGAWIKPLALVRALLSHPNIRFMGLHEVDSLQKNPSNGEWQLRIKHHIAIPSMGSSHTYTNESAPHVVLATGAHTPNFLNQVLYEPDMGLHPIAGQVSWGLQTPHVDAILPTFAVNGHGSFVAHVPTPEGKAWFSGATFERHQTSMVVRQEAHAHNLERLRHLLPKVGKAMQDSWHTDKGLRAWNGVRCAAINRLPKVGPLGQQRLPGLYILSALGARGLTTALWCAQLLADHVEGQPVAVAKALQEGMRCE